MGILKKFRSPKNEPKKAQPPKIDKTGFIKCEHCGRRVPPDFFEKTEKGGIFEYKIAEYVCACMHCLYDEPYPPECQEDG